MKVKFIEKFSNIITLSDLKEKFMDTNFHLTKKGNRLSVMPVPPEISKKIIEMKNNSK